MSEIIIKGVIETPENISLGDEKCVSQLNNTSGQDEFVEYMDNGLLKDKLLSGYMSFKVINTENDIPELYVYVNYKLMEDQSLTNSEIQELMKYTSGQLSDGIGEGFEQQEAFYNEEDEEVFISPWFYGQILTHSLIE